MSQPPATINTFSIVLSHTQSRLITSSHHKKWQCDKIIHSLSHSISHSISQSINQSVTYQVLTVSDTQTAVPIQSATGIRTTQWISSLPQCPQPTSHRHCMHCHSHCTAHKRCSPLLSSQHHHIPAIQCQLTQTSIAFDSTIFGSTQVKSTHTLQDTSLPPQMLHSSYTGTFAL